MGDNLVRRIKATLTAQCYIMNDSWMKECVEYYTSEHNEATAAEVEAFVISQWLLSDLRDINNENGCLPRGLLQQKSTILPGKYMLQMEKMYDISTSKYSQIEKIRKVSNVNLEATDIKPQAWEPTGKRMMQLYLSDGIQEVIAIERKPIASLKANLYPGFKVMIVGPVECRRGVILLEEKNLKEIGGEIDTLLKANALENVLARALNLEENPDPYNDKNKQSTNNEIQNDFPEDEFDIDFDELTNIEQQIEQNPNPVQSNMNNNNANTTTVQSRERNSNNANKPTTSNRSSMRNSNLSGNRNGKNSGKTNTITSYYQKKPPVETIDELFDDGDDILASIDESQITLAVLPTQDSKITIDISIKTGTNRPTPFIVQPKESEFPDDDDDLIVMDSFDVFEMENEPRIKPKREQEVVKPSTSTNNELQCETRDNLQQGKYNVTKTEQGNNHVSPDQNSIFYKSTTDFHEIPSDDFKFKLPDSVAKNASEIRDKQLPSNISNNAAIGTSKPSNLNVKNILSMPSTSGNKRPATELSPPVCSPPKVKCLQETPRLSKINRKITEFTGKVLPKDKIPLKIRDFICDVITEPVTGLPVSKTVRGKVTHLGKLAKKENSWYLEATITDGTASTDITFASALLEHQIGFSVAEFLEKKKMRKSDPTIDEEMRKRFRTAEVKLHKLDALLNLELSEGKKPNVISFQEMTDEQKELFDKRLKVEMKC